MQVGFRSSVVLVLLTAASLAIHADTPVSQAADVQYTAWHAALFGGALSRVAGGVSERPEVAGRAPAARGPGRRGAGGVAGGRLRHGAHQGEALAKAAPRDADAMALYGDSLWASGLFEEAELRYRDALAFAPELPRGFHGMARSMLARSQLDEAMNQAQAALRLAPRDLEVHHTVGAIYERMHKYEEAAVAYGNYVNLLPNKDTSEKASWSRAEIRFLRSFAQRVPFEADPGTDDQVFTVDFKLVNDKVVVRARVNDAGPQDFVVDTGAESTIITEPTARRLGVAPITYTLSAGVGETGLRGLQLARINSLELGTLKLRNVPCIIKSPPLRDLPSSETESLSPIALGYSMIIDYKTHKLTFGKHLPIEAGDLELPLRVYRLVTVRGVVAKRAPGEFRRGHRRRGDFDQPGDRQPAAGQGRRPQDRAARVRIVGLGSRRVPDAGRRSGLRHHQIHEFSGRRAEPQRAERAARLSARRDCRPQVPERLPRRHRPRTVGSAAQVDRFTLEAGGWRLRVEPSGFASSSLYSLTASSLRNRIQSKPRSAASGIPRRR